MVELDNFILEIDDYLKTFNQRYMFCGSISLYLNGISEITEFGDIDIDFVDLNKDEILDLAKYIVYTYPVDILLPIDGLERKYHSINFKGRNLLVSDLDYEYDARLQNLKIPNYVYKDKALDRIKLLDKYCRR